MASEGWIKGVQRLDIERRNIQLHTPVPLGRCCSLRPKVTKEPRTLDSITVFHKIEVRSDSEKLNLAVGARVYIQHVRYVPDGESAYLPENVFS